MRYAPLFILGLMMAGPLLAAPADPSLVQITVTCQEENPQLPWQTQPPARRIGYGVLVAANQILTTESLVRNHRLVQVRQPGRGDYATAIVELVDAQLNLASLRMVNGHAVSTLLPISFAPGCAATGDVQILQFDDTSEIQRGNGQLMQVSMAGLPSAPFATLLFDVLTDLNVNGEGAPVVIHEKLAGLMTSYVSAKRSGQMLPVTTLRRFLDDMRTPPYKGAPMAGIAWGELVDPAKRAFLKAAPGQGGILIQNCWPGMGGRDVLQPMDVILQLDGMPIDNMGFYNDPEFGRLKFTYLVQRRTPGEKMGAQIIRNGVATNVMIRLDRFDERSALIPENTAGEPAEYLVEGGLIIRELDGKYLDSYGSNWETETDPRFAYAYHTRRMNPEQPGDRMVIVSDVLPDRCNVGYQEMSQEIITAVNGQPIRNISDVFRIMEQDGHIRTLRLQGFDIDIALDTEELPAANLRIAQRFRIPSLRRTHATPVAPAHNPPRQP